MKASSSITALHAALLIGMAYARTLPPAGSIQACHEQTCNNCASLAASIEEGFPNCYIYQSSGAELGSTFSSAGGHGYDVWWNSGKPNDMCKIVVRTPASQDISQCGYFLTSWSDAGCYYTNVQDTFNLQFCCGTGDCNAASPAADMADAQAQALMGNTTWLSIDIGDEFASGAISGKRSIDGVGEMVWRKQAYAEREEVAEPEVAAKPKVKDVRTDNLVGRDCVFHPTSDLVTEAGKQVRVSDTQVCNTDNGCSVAVSTTVTASRSITPMIGIMEDVWGAISASVSETFTTGMTYMVTSTYMQTSGTTGYVSFIPTMDCYEGTFSGCYASTGKSAFLIDSKQVFRPCTPETRDAGDNLREIVGTTSFVYVNK